ncbi:MAG TPA: hypothetical protein PL187_18190, partial [Caldilinea sp.]|nr:hypothetical protein [Caldilinea sp.]
MTLALSLLIVLGFLLVFAGWFSARYAADARRPSAAVSLQAPVQASVDSPLPAPSSVRPTEEIIVITPPPDGGVIVLPPAKPGQIYAFPSPTPFPTWTPRPTPTRRPGPTATPFPTRQPAPSGAGVILFTTSTDSAGEAIKKLPVNAQGEKIAEVTSITLSIDFDPYLIAPSPDESHLLLMRPMMPGGLPYSLDTKNEQVRPLFSESSSS